MEQACLRGLRVLIVEDELLIAMGHESALLEHGCEVVGTASTLEKALRMIEERRPDAVLLDGNLDGRMTAPVAELLDQLEIPYLLISGYVQIALTDPILSRAPLIEKPVMPDQLIQAMVEQFC